MLKGKTVLLGVSGGIAAYKLPNLASMLVKQHAQVHVLMTRNATNFIHPTAFETLTGHKCLIDTFDRNFEFQVEHVSLAKQADVVLVAPATANIIGKMANGIADDMLTTTLLACKCPKLVAPAMNTNMYENPIVQHNLELLRGYGMKVITPACGHLACGDSGMGKMPEVQELYEHILREIAFPKDMQGLRVLVTAGPTIEPLDPVRFLTNHSTGKMGYALAENAMLRGAQVTLISGRTSLAPPPFVEVVPVTTAQEMYDAVMERFEAQDILVKAAAVADYRPKEVSQQKLKKSDDELTLTLTRTRDILGALGARRRPDQFLCGFAMETQDLLDNARKKLEKKHADLIVANSLTTQGAGFGGDTNVVTLVTKKGAHALPMMSKAQTAAAIFDEIMKQRTGE